MAYSLTPDGPGICRINQQTKIPGIDKEAEPADLDCQAVSDHYERSLPAQHEHYSMSTAHADNEEYPSNADANLDPLLVRSEAPRTCRATSLPYSLTPTSVGSCGGHWGNSKVSRSHSTPATKINEITEKLKNSNITPTPYEKTRSNNSDAKPMSRYNGKNEGSNVLDYTESNGLGPPREKYCGDAHPDDVMTGTHSGKILTSKSTINDQNHRDEKMRSLRHASQNKTKGVSDLAINYTGLRSESPEQEKKFPSTYSLNADNIGANGAYFGGQSHNLAGKPLYGTPEPKHKFASTYSLNSDGTGARANGKTSPFEPFPVKPTHAYSTENGLNQFEQVVTHGFGCHVDVHLHLSVNK